MTDILKGIIAHIITRNSKNVSALSQDYTLTYNQDHIIVSKEILLEEGISKESVDAKTEELGTALNKLNTIEEKISPAQALIRKNIRGRTEKDKETEIPKGYILEINKEGTKVIALAHLDEIPFLAGYGSLLDLEQVAANTASGNLRNTTDSQVRKQLAFENQVDKKLGYYKMNGFELIFNRAPTAKRHGATQKERNQYAVLNIQNSAQANAYVCLYDPEKLTKDPLLYLARENFDEIEYARKRIEIDNLEHKSGANIVLDKPIWILQSPLITDVDKQVQWIGVGHNATIKENYIEMITNGLTGAAKTSHQFVENYCKNTITPNGKPLSEHSEFMECLQSKLIRTAK